MQWRKNKYQRNKKGYIIDNAKGKEDDKLKGKTNEEAVLIKTLLMSLKLMKLANLF